jgi:hypothetical protein
MLKCTVHDTWYTGMSCEQCTLDGIKNHKGFNRFSDIKFNPDKRIDIKKDKKWFNDGW